MRIHRNNGTQLCSNIKPTPARSASERERTTPARSASERERTTPARSASERERTTPARSASERERTTPARSASERERTTPARSASERERTTPARSASEREHPRLRVGLVSLAASLLIVTGCAPIGNGNPPNFVVDPAPKNAVQVRGQGPAGDGLKNRVEEVLKHIKNRELLTTHSFWTVIHGILANGLETQLRDPITRTNINAVDFICNGGQPRGLQFFVYKTGVDVRIGPQFDGQGHQDQFIGEMAQCGLPLDRTFIIDGEKYTFKDFMDHAKARASVVRRDKEDQELSWTLVALSEYYGTDISWKNRHGDDLHFDDLVRYELGQPIMTKAACGGTHRLFGLTWAYHLHLKNGGKQTPLWKQVEFTIKKYQDKAREVQNADGSFSTAYFQKRDNVPDIDRRIGCTGHIMEWLALSLPDEELKKPWMQDAANALCRLILEGEGRLLDAGSLYHAAHGLRIYYDRVYGSPQPERTGIPLPQGSKK